MIRGEVIDPALMGNDLLGVGPQPQIVGNDLNDVADQLIILLSRIFPAGTRLNFVFGAGPF
jgi:hypothetical protein